MISWDVVGLDLSGLSLVGLVCGKQQVRSLWAWLLVWLQVGCLLALLVLATGEMPVSMVRFWLHV
jgi:hypothetical protein